MRAHSSWRLGTLRGTTPELLVSPWYCAWGFCVVWEAGLPHKTSSPPTQRRNGRACSSLTARGGGLPVGVKRPCHKTPYRCPHRLNLSSQSSRSCALPNIKTLKDKDLEFANSIRPISAHGRACRVSPAHSLIRKSPKAQQCWCHA